MPSLKDSRLHLVILLGVCALVFFYSFHTRALWTSGEDRAAQIAVEMTQTGNWIIPHLNDEVTLTKPPLLHWLIALCYKVFGISEFSARLPSALAATAAVLAIYFFASRLWDAAAGLISALVLATSMEFVWHARSARIDTLLTLLTLAALASFYLAYSSRHRSRVRYLPFYAFAALATLAKGPPGFLLVLTTVLIFLGIRKEFSQMRLFASWRGLLLFAAIALPWYAAVVLKAPPDKVKYFFFGQTAEWVGGKARLPSEPFCYHFNYLFYLVKGFFPWVLFLPLACVRAVKSLEHHQRPERFFLLVWFGAGLVGLSLFPSKAARYLLPLYPAAALLVGVTWREAIREDAHSLRRWVLGLSIAAVAFNFVLIVTTTVWALADGRPPVWLCALAGKRFPGIHAELGADIASLTLAVVGFLILGAVSLVRLQQQRIAQGFALLVLLLVAQVGFFVARALPGVERYYNARGFCQRINQLAGSHQLLATAGHWHYWMRFYLGRHVDRITPEDMTRYLGSNDNSCCLISAYAYNKLSEQQRSSLEMISPLTTQGKVIYLVTFRR